MQKWLDDYIEKLKSGLLVAGAAIKYKTDIKIAADTQQVCVAG